MKNVVFESETVDLYEHETVLDALLRCGYDISYGCRSGVCQSCVLAADDSSDTFSALESSQSSLSPEEKSLNYFLACQCKIPSTMSVEEASKSLNIRRIGHHDKYMPATVIDKTWLNRSVIRLRLESDLLFKPGQYITLSTIDQGSEVARSYSIASQPDTEDYLELHIKRINGGRFSSLIDESVNVGDSLGIKGPMGKCIYSAGEEDQTLLLAAIGTGFAPIYGILKDALRHNHRGDIHVLVGAKERSSLYLVEELQALVAKHPNVFLHFVVLDPFPDVEVTEEKDLHLGDLYQYVKNLFPDTKNVKIYLCGAESFVKKMRRQCFMSGANMSDIHADVFLPFVTE